MHLYICQLGILSRHIYHSEIEAEAK